MLDSLQGNGLQTLPPPDISLPSPWSAIAAMLRLAR